MEHHERRLERMRESSDRKRICGRIEGMKAVLDMLDRWTEMYGEESWEAWSCDPYADGLLEEEKDEY